MRFLLFSLSVLFIGCTTDPDFNSETNKVNSDSIAYYNTQAQKQEFTLKERGKFAAKAFRLAKQKDRDSRLARLLYQKSWLHYSLGEYDSLVRYDTFLKQLEKASTDHKTIAGQHYLMGYYYQTVAQQPDSAFLRYNRSKYYYQREGDSSGVAKALLNMGSIQKEHNDFFGSKETLTEALSYIDSISDGQTYYSALDRLAQDHRRLRNLDEAISLYKNIIKNGSGSDSITYKNNLATVYIDKKDFDKAMLILEELNADTLSKPIQNLKARILDNLAYARWSAERSQDVEEFLKPLLLRKEAEDKRGKIASYTHLGEFYMKKQPDRALAYFDSVIALSRVLKTPRAEQDALRFKMLLKPKDLDYKTRYITLEDNVYNAELKVKTQFAKYKYDDRLKQESILRLEKENVENTLKLTQERYVRLWIIAALVVAIMLAILFYFRQKHRAKRLQDAHKIDRLKAIYDTEASIAQRLHDDFGSGLNSAMLLLQRDQDPEEVLDRLEVLYDQSRDFSRTLNEIDTGVHYPKVLSTMLHMQTPDESNLLLLSYQQISWHKLNPVGKITLYKVLRELMVNMRKHSSAKLVTLKFENIKDHLLRVTYVDNGKGADPESLILKNGLQITEKRIQAINGKITFETAKGKGFKAVITMPY